MTLKTKDMRKVSREFIQKQFAENPNQSIDAVARTCSNEGLPADKGTITGIRAAVRYRKGPSPFVEVLKKPVVPRKLVMAPVLPAPSIQSMQRALGDMLEVDPYMTECQVEEKLKAEFGASLDSTYIKETLSVSRELAADAQVRSDKKEEKVPQQPAQGPQEDQNVLLRFTAATKEELSVVIPRSKLQRAIELHLSQGVQPESITVWKKMKVAIRVQVDLE